MAGSDDPIWARRAANPRAVEGTSEIDIVVGTETSLVFVEAKLGSDVSKRTTYDPLRNQIVRNIDCLLESAVDRTPFFWLLVKDRDPNRKYTQLYQSYRAVPGELTKLLPHRARCDVE